MAHNNNNTPLNATRLFTVCTDHQIIIFHPEEFSESVVHLRWINVRGWTVGKILGGWMAIRLRTDRSLDE